MKDDISYVILTAIYTAFSKLLLWKHVFHSVYCHDSQFNFSRRLAHLACSSVYRMILCSISVGRCFEIKLGHFSWFLDMIVPYECLEFMFCICWFAPCLPPWLSSQCSSTWLYFLGEGKSHYLADVIISWLYYRVMI